MHTTTAARIAPSTHAGRWTRKGTPAGMRTSRFTAAELADMLGQGGEPFTVWEFSGHVNGQPLFHRTRLAAQPDGSLAAYSSEGQRVAIHPADRTLAILCR